MPVGQGCTHFPKMWESFQNSGCEKGHIGPTNIRAPRYNGNRLGGLESGIYASLQ
jgi:hypothetical protein